MRCAVSLGLSDATWAVTAARAMIQGRLMVKTKQQSDQQVGEGKESRRGHWKLV